MVKWSVMEVGDVSIKEERRVQNRRALCSEQERTLLLLRTRNNW